MPLNRDAVKSAFGDEGTDKEEDKGFFGRILDVGQKLGPLGYAQEVAHGLAPGSLADTATDAVTSNVAGAAQMFNPVSLAPNLIRGIGGGIAGTGKEVARLIPTALASATGKSVDELDQSMLSFGINTDLLRAGQDQSKPLAERIHGVVGQVAPIATTLADPIAETGIRGGSLLASALSQTGRAGGPLTAMTPEEMLAQSGNQEMSYEARAREGKGLATAIGDAMLLAPATRGAGGAAESAGILGEAGAGRLNAAAGVMEQAPLAPITIPGKAIYQGLQRSAAGETAFPGLSRLAQNSRSNIAALPEPAAVVEGQIAASPLAAAADEAAQNLAMAQAKAAEATTAPQVLADLRSQKVGGSHINSPEAVARRAEVARLKGLAEELPARQAEVTAAREAATAANTALDAERGSMLAQVEGQRAGLKPSLAAEGAQRLESVVNQVGDVWAKTGARNEALRTIADRMASLEQQPGFKELDEAARNEIIKDLKANAIKETKTEFLRGRGQESPGEGLVGIDAQGNVIKTDASGNVINPNKTQSLSRANAEAQEMQTGVRPKETKAENVGQESLFGDEAQVGRNDPVMYVPEHVNKLYEKAMEGIKGAKSENAFVNLFDEVTRGWKAGVLPMNPAWQANNVVSNSITAMTHGGVDPVWFWKNKGRIAEEIANPKDLAHALGAGSGHEFIPTTEAITRPGAAVRKLSEKAYKANSAVDEWSHMSVALKEFDKLKAQGMPRAQAARIASDRARQVMGDFENMSAFEKNAIKRAIPFYTWAKHSAKFNLRELIENPVRQTRLAAGSQALAPPGQSEQGDFLASAVPLAGGRFLNSGAFNMQQGTAGGITESPFTNPKSLLGQVHPLAQSIFAGAGIDPRTGQELSVAPDQSFLSGVGGYVMNQNPLVKTAADLKERADYGGTNVAKGDVRNVLTANGRPISTRTEDVAGIPAPLLKFLTGMSVQAPDLAGQTKRKKAKEKSDKKRTKTYVKNSKKSAK